MLTRITNTDQNQLYLLAYRAAEETENRTTRAESLHELNPMAESER